MDIRPIDTLGALADVLAAPPERRPAAFRARVVAPLRPFWDLPWLPRDASDPDPEGTAARMMNLYGPDDDPVRGLAALDAFARADSFAACLEAVRRADAALRPEAHGVPLHEVAVSLVLMRPGSAPQSEDYTGWGAQPGLVMVAAFPNERNLPKLPAAAAHEFHHNVRLSVEPFHPVEITVGQYLVIEGLAQALEAELYGEDRLGPWAGGAGGAEPDALVARFGRDLERSGFDAVRAFMFGDEAAERFGLAPLGVPPMAGYAVGYRVVRAFLERRRLDVAAATYLPWREIVEGSGAFATRAD